MKKIYVGTRKGLFTARSEDRRRWEVKGPHRLDSADQADMSAVYAVGINPHGGRILAGTENSHFGPSVRYSDDHGRTWSAPLTISGDGLGGDLGYPSTVECDDGTFVTVWYEKLKVSPLAQLRQARWRLNG